MHQKLNLDQFSFLMRNPKQLLHARSSFKLRYFEGRFSKDLKKLTLFLLSRPVPFNTQKGPETSDKLLFKLQNKFRKITLLVMYCLTKFDDVT